MEITYLGHSSFKLKGDSTSLVTDPFSESMVGMKCPPTDAEIVTVSHNHQDHNQASEVSGVRKVIDGPGEYEISGVSILGFASFHDNKEGAERGKNVIFVIEMDDIRLCHLGDLGHNLTDDQINALGDIDVLFIPVGDTYTIDAKVAKDLTLAIEAKITIPMHYGSDKLNKENFGSLAPVSDFLSIIDLKVENEKKLKLKAGSLPPDPKIVVFNGQ